MAFYVVSVGFGLLSEKRLSRWLSTYLLAIAVAWYGWDAVGLPGSLYPWNVISHTVIGLAIAVAGPRRSYLATLEWHGLTSACSSQGAAVGSCWAGTAGRRIVGFPDLAAPCS
ncbi:MAG: hypothetical protein IPF77_17010 [Gemmatimonadetes bacterium]|nr:hypothetical protein [Gemmatimonadota bacterium]